LEKNLQVKGDTKRSLKNDFSRINKQKKLFESFSLTEFRIYFGISFLPIKWIAFKTFCCQFKIS